jgi:6-phosphofructokinase 1
MSSSSKNSPALLAVVSVTSVVLTYVTLSFLQSRRDEKARAEAFDDSRAAKLKQKEKQISAGEPDGTLLDDVKLDRVYMWDVEKLSERFPAEGKVVNRMQFGSQEEENDLFASLKRSTSAISEDEPDPETNYNKLINNHDCVVADLVRKAGGDNWTRAYLRAGPRKNLHFYPKTVNVAIVTCGGLCPGLNNVVREIAKSLKMLYGVEGDILGKYI